MAAVVGAAVALVLIAAAVAVAFDVGRWGCKSQAELERTRPPAEVATAFADAGSRCVRLVGVAVVLVGGRLYAGRFDGGEPRLLLRDASEASWAR